ncbi:MAG: PLP-dependent transferase [Prevotella sp.]|nr:PLP-dependent transferase [Prevotella sp.]
MKKQTLATLTNYQQPDAYGALSMPVYHCCAFEFDTAKHMTDAFTGRVSEPEYVRVMNPTVTFFENRVKSLTGAQNVFAFNSGMAAITNVLLCFVKAGKNIVTSNHLFGNTVSLMRNTLGPLGIPFPPSGQSGLYGVAPQFLP